MEMKQANTGRGIVFTGSHEDGLRTVVVHAPSLDQGASMSRTVANLTARLADFAGVVGVADSQYKASARADHLKAASVNVLSKAFTEAQGDGRKEGQQIAAARAVAMSVDPATPATAHIRQRALARWDACETVGDKGSLIDGLSTEGLAALIETDAYRDVPAEMQKQITEKYMLKRHIERTGLQSDWPLQPDHLDPLRTGPNVDAAMAAARKAVNTLNTRADTVANVSDTLRATVDLVALCTDLPRDQAYNLLVSGNAAT
ncbi:hypothetical protein [Bradyrhizobium japonicum]|jgi:hypothetical protein|uniref:hypothetical protein n=1 Tax=Bradyrhizobium japonicum TaxID=375 RepID=UPI001E2CDE63|nr:hypothetical protein [Bradyrhizobium japonicum]MCD9825332.1 hypothetical protein [Bradyrhizobium japonicum]MCD9898309.1 hypothetical protein [Bradyrhizobium japonicum]MCP1766097.1 hypothetical protein [Bradyrhizobium japonicum]MCP1788235.1 hypothetical protein [Bradyrhizobium japonicum]MCP1810110.1 hypothetical protein [Bradyrhizobium japonicum]